MPELTPKRKRFVEEYLIDFNGTQAAIRAGYSKKTANEQAAQLLAILSIKEEVQKGKDRLAEEARLSALDYWRMIAELRDFDPVELFDENGVAKDMGKIPRAIRQCLKGYKVSSKIITGTDSKGKEKQDAFADVDFKYPDRLAVAKEIGNALGISSSDTIIKLPPTLEIFLQQEKKR